MQGLGMQPRGWHGSVCQFCTGCRAAGRACELREGPESCGKGTCNSEPKAAPDLQPARLWAPDFRLGVWAGRTLHGAAG